MTDPQREEFHQFTGGRGVNADRDPFDAGFERIGSALAAPLIVHERTPDAIEYVPEEIVADARLSRLEQAILSPFETGDAGNEGVERNTGNAVNEAADTHATIAEAMVYCWTASLDGACANDPEFVAAYTVAAKRYAASKGGSLPDQFDELPSMAEYRSMVEAATGEVPDWFDALDHEIEGEVTLADGERQLDQLRRWIRTQQREAIAGAGDTTDSDDSDGETVDGESGEKGTIEENRGTGKGEGGDA